MEIYKIEKLLFNIRCFRLLLSKNYPRFLYIMIYQNLYQYKYRSIHPYNILYLMAVFHLMNFNTNRFVMFYTIHSKILYIRFCLKDFYIFWCLKLSIRYLRSLFCRYYHHFLYIMTKQN
jgi:hypothetical protein